MLLRRRRPRIDITIIITTIPRTTLIPTRIARVTCTTMQCSKPSRRTRTRWPLPPTRPRRPRRLARLRPRPLARRPARCISTSCACSSATRTALHPRTANTRPIQQSVHPPARVARHSHRMAWLRSTASRPQAVPTLRPRYQGRSPRSPTTTPSSREPQERKKLKRQGGRESFRPISIKPPILV